jgi:ATP synthase protein I
MGKDSDKNWMSDFGPFLTLGLQLAISVVVFFFLGRWLDGVFDTSPWLMIAGLVLGTAGGFVNFFRTALSIGRKVDQETEEEKRLHRELKREN